MHIWWKHAVSIYTPYIRYVSGFGFCEMVVFQILNNISTVSSEESKELFGAIIIFLYIYKLYCVKILI